MVFTGRGIHDSFIQADCFLGLERKEDYAIERERAMKGTPWKCQGGFHVSLRSTTFEQKSNEHHLND